MMTLEVLLYYQFSQFVATLRVFDSIFIEMIYRAFHVCRKMLEKSTEAILNCTIHDSVACIIYNYFHYCKPKISNIIILLYRFVQHSLIYTHIYYLAQSNFIRSSVLSKPICLTTYYNVIPQRVPLITSLSRSLSR